MARLVAPPLPLLFAAAAAAAAASASASAPPARSGVDFASDSPALNAAWAFAVPMAMSYLQTGLQPGFIASYWAGLLDRPAFYARDMAHQALGAHVLGLDAENLSMLRVFAASATAGAREHFPLWSFDFKGAIYPLDYHSDDNYVRETPTPFDLLCASARLHAWTGDNAYRDDPALWAAHTAFAVGDFIPLHDPLNESIAGQANPSGNIFYGAASYVENGEGLIVAADTLAKQAAALGAYARFQEQRGNTTGAASTRAAAAALVARFNSAEWYSEGRGYGRGITRNGMQFGYLETQSVFPGTSYILEPGARTDAHIAMVVAAASASGTELRTYVPELLFLYGQASEAAEYIAQLLADPRNTYPEVSFTLVADLTVHMLGLEPVPGGGSAGGDNLLLTTLGLSMPANATTATARHVPVAGRAVAVTQSVGAAAGSAATVLLLESGPALSWEARFRGSAPQLRVNGTLTAATAGVSRAGLPFTSVLVQLTAGQAVIVETPA
jgi:hypothetical protein